jgi:hypothetical protein
LLAGALVLSCGMIPTVTSLASWADGEYATGTYAASVFVTQSSVDGGLTWSDNADSPGAALVLDVADLRPTTVAYTSFALRTSSDSVAGTATLEQASTDNAALADALEYRVVLYTSGGCSQATFTSPQQWIAGDASAWLALVAALPTAGASAPLAGHQAAATQYCFGVRMKSGASNSLQGQSLHAVWQFNATTT